MIKIKKPKFKIIQTIFLLLAFVGILILAFKWLSKPTQAAWFDDGWNYRKAITVTVTTNASDISNLETLLTIDTTGITAKLQSACQDLRFTNVSGKALTYYIDTCTNNSATNKVWVMADLVPKNTTTYTIYMYYGNPTATSKSDSTTFYDVNGLVGYWTMNEASWTNDCSTGTVKDSSVTGQNALACPNTTGPTGGATGQYGNAGLFDGTNDYLDMGNISAWDLNSYTISGWFKTSDSTDFKTITNRGLSTTNRTWAVLVWKNGFGGGFNDGALVFKNSSGGVADVNIGTTVSVADGNWHHFVATVNAGVAANLYVDGVNKATGTSAGNADHPSTSGIIGNDPSGAGNRFFNGNIDDIHFYNRALTDPEARKLFTNPNSINTTATTTSRPTTAFASEEIGPGPIASWHFDEGYGTTTSDATGHGFTSTLTSGPTWQTEDQCVSGKCIFFDGSNDYLLVGNIAALKVDTKTVSFWAKPIGTISAARPIFSSSDGSNGNYYVGFTGTNNMIASYGITAGCAQQTVSTTNSPVVPNAWHFYSYTFSVSGSNVAIKFYIDGNLANTANFATGYCTTYGTSFVIGAFTSASLFYNGFLDNVQVYAYARSAAQIKTDYVAGKSGNSPSKGAGTVLGGNRDQVNQALSNGLLGYWKMDEASWTQNCTATSVTDSSGNARNGKSCPSTTGPAGGALGKFNFGGSFDGTDDEITISDTGLPTGTQSRTVAAWVNPSSVSGNHVPVFYGNGATNDAFYIVQKATNFCIGQWGGGDNCGTTVIATSTWYHVALTYDGVNATLYLNGVREVSAPRTYTTTLPGSMYLGSYGLTTETWAGKMDEARIYNRTLNGAEISLLYNWAPGPFIYYPMDENTGTTTVHDVSGNGNDGTMQGSMPATDWVPGKYGSALAMDGSDDYVQTPALTLNNSKSVSIWAKFNSTGRRQILFGRSAAYVFFIESSNLISVYAGALATFGTAITTNTWYHYELVTDASTSPQRHYVYQNGVLLGSTNAAGSQGINNLISAVGDQYQDQENCDCTLDDFRLYNYARTAKQVVEDMNSGHPVGGSPIASQLGYWNLDEQQGTIANDKAIWANNLTLGATTAAPTWKVAGSSSCKINGCQSFDGGDNDDVADNNSLSATGSATLTAWVNKTTSAREEMFFGKWNGTTQGEYDLFSDSTGHPKMCISSTGSDSDCVTGRSVLSASTWYHVAGAYNADAKTLSVYVNGLLDGTKTTTLTAMFDSTSSFRVAGTQTSTVANSFIGSMDEVKIYSSALTLAELKIDMNAGSAMALGGVLGTQNNEGVDGAAPVGWWKFDDNTGTSAVDFSGNANTGTLTNTPLWKVGKIGSALSFNGTNQWVDLGNANTSLRSTGDDTLEAWVYLDPTFSADGDVFIRHDGGSWGVRAFIRTADRKIQYSIVTTSPGVVQTDLVSNTAIPLGSWHHITCVWLNGVSMNIYIDGALDKTTAKTGTTVRISSTTSSVIGAKDVATTPSLLFNGLIDDVRFYDYARSNSQIAYDYNRGAPVAWYKLDECQGTTAYNTAPTATGSGTINNGTISIGAGAAYTTPGTCGSGSSSEAWSHGTDNGAGKFNYALGFDGNDDKVTIPEAKEFDFGTEMTVSAWVKFANTSGNQVIVSKYGSGSGHTFMLYKASDDTPQFLIDKTDGTGFTQTCTNGDPSEIATWVAGRWYHMVGVYKSGSIFRIYINGKNFGCDSAGLPSGNLFVSTTDVWIGNAVGYANPFNGLIDDVRLYNYALSDAQIKTLYNSNAAFFGPATGSP